MSNQLSVKQAERRAMSFQFKDGLLEITLGAVFALLALVNTLEETGLSRFESYLPAIVVFVVGMIAYYVLKAKVVSPRLGMIDISLRRNTPRGRLLILAIALQMVTLVIFIMASIGSLGETLQNAPSGIVDAGFGLAIFSFFALMGYYGEAARFYLYGLLLGAAMPIQQIFWPDPQGFFLSPNLLAGVVMMLVGSWVFASFIRQYPVVLGEVGNG